MPVLGDGPSGRPAVNAALLAGIVARAGASLAYVEQVGPRPTDGCVHAFAFGHAKGTVQGVLAACGVPVAFLTPPVWKRAVGLPPGKEGAKDRSRSAAIGRWPAKAALLAFADAIGSKRKLGADEAGNPRIEGKHGRIYVQPRTCDPGRAPKFQIYFSTGHATGWRFAREALGAFARLTNDAYDEGLLLIERLPSAEEGEVIRDKLGIFKRVVYSEEVLAARRAQIARMNAARLEAAAGGVSEVKILDCKPVGDFAGVEIAEDPPTAVWLEAEEEV